MSWEKVYHNPVTIEETHKAGVDRTVLTLSTGGNEQDIQAMLELYGDLIDTPEPQREPQTDQKTTQTTDKTTQKGPQSNQKSDQKIEDGLQSSQKTTLKVSESDQKIALSSQKSNQENITSTQKVIEKLSINPQITISRLAVDLAMSPSGIKKILKAMKESGRIQRVGPDKGGHWEVLESK